MIASALQAGGALLLVVGVAVLAGVGFGLVAAGIALLAFGIAEEIG